MEYQSPHSAGKTTASRDEILQQLTKSVFHHQTVEIKYRPAVAIPRWPAKSIRIGFGMSIMVSISLGLDHLKHDIRVFAVERICAITLTNRRFEVPIRLCV